MRITKQVLVIDTSLLCVWLKVPGKETCGQAGDLWNFDRVNKEIRNAIESGYTLVLPLATIIETGNHIAQGPEKRRKTAESLANLMEKVAAADTPWAAFRHQTELWGPAQLRELAKEWPPLAESKFTLGDATIKRIADFYATSGCEVRILTADKHLQAHEPAPPPIIPRRRQKQ